jgi:hypothetical protein
MDEDQAVQAVLRVFPGAQVVDDPVCQQLIEAVEKGHEGILEHSVKGARMPTTYHALAPCDVCGEVSMVGITRDRIKGRGQWPSCRMTPKCEGRHAPQ